MRTFWRLFGGAVLAVIVAAGTVVLYIRTTGLDSRAESGSVETRLARLARGLAVPADVKSMRNPVSLAPDVLAEGLAHFADHCAACHGDDGTGNTEMGRGLYPKAPDMRQTATQSLTDGELFYVIEHGIRFTGMPAWRTGTGSGEEASWQLVHVIRHLPKLTDAERERMKAFIPRSPEEVRHEIEEERFLNGEETPEGPR